MATEADEFAEFAEAQRRRAARRKQMMAEVSSAESAVSVKVPQRTRSGESMGGLQQTATDADAVARASKPADDAISASSALPTVPSATAPSNLANVPTQTPPQSGVTITANPSIATPSTASTTTSSVADSALRPGTAAQTSASSMQQVAANVDASSVRQASQPTAVGNYTDRPPQGHTADAGLDQDVKPVPEGSPTPKRSLKKKVSKASLTDRPTDNEHKLNEQTEDPKVVLGGSPPPKKVLKKKVSKASLVDDTEVASSADTRSEISPKKVLKKKSSKASLTNEGDSTASSTLPADGLASVPEGSTPPPARKVLKKKMSKALLPDESKADATVATTGTDGARDTTGSLIAPNLSSDTAASLKIDGDKSTGETASAHGTGESASVAQTLAGTINSVVAQFQEVTLHPTSVVGGAVHHGAAEGHESHRDAGTPTAEATAQRSVKDSVAPPMALTESHTADGSMALDPEYEQRRQEREMRRRARLAEIEAGNLVPSAGHPSKSGGPAGVILSGHRPPPGPSRPVVRQTSTATLATAGSGLTAPTVPTSALKATVSSDIAHVPGSKVGQPAAVATTTDSFGRDSTRRAFDRTNSRNTLFTSDGSAPALAAASAEKEALRVQEELARKRQLRQAEEKRQQEEDRKRELEEREKRLGRQHSSLLVSDATQPVSTVAAPISASAVVSASKSAPAQAVADSGSPRRPVAAVPLPAPIKTDEATKHVGRREARDDMVAASPATPTFAVGKAVTACHSCRKRVYGNEGVEVERLLMHKSCFRCAHPKCSTTLKETSYGFINGNFYCKPHHRSVLAGVSAQSSTSYTVANLAPQSKAPVPSAAPHLTRRDSVDKARPRSMSTSVMRSSSSENGPTASSSLSSYAGNLTHAVIVSPQKTTTTKKKNCRRGAELAVVDGPLILFDNRCRLAPPHSVCFKDGWAVGWFAHFRGAQRFLSSSKRTDPTTAAPVADTKPNASGKPTVVVGSSRPSGTSPLTSPAMARMAPSNSPSKTSLGGGSNLFGGPKLTGKQALLEWCRQATVGYPRVSVVNFTSSWADGLAFCAVVHRYRASLIDYDAMLDAEPAIRTAKAFAAAASLGILQLLDVGDVVNHAEPDELSIITYLSENYHFFKKELYGFGYEGVRK